MIKTASQQGTSVILGHTQVTSAKESPGGQDGNTPTQDASFTETCLRANQVLARIGDKWTLLVVMTLAGGPRRFSELKRSIDGVSQRMLTLTLRGLERDGLVHRKAYGTVPPRVDYALTPLGRSLREPVEELGAWALAHADTVEAARRAFDAAEPSEER
ncbi:winged helix-turn-helix transcriptional regulator [Acidovorax sacchari]|uniref:winged helix-turn-helix transcriptional regulator n=1 Tax=Acidovorax sacchari TaxID=3230736 RepID=UPI0039E36B89